MKGGQGAKGRVKVNRVVPSSAGLVTQIRAKRRRAHERAQKERFCARGEGEIAHAFDELSTGAAKITSVCLLIRAQLRPCCWHARRGSHGRRKASSSRADCCRTRSRPKL